MLTDDHVCLCFHVTKRKLLNFIRIEKPKWVSQLSECLCGESVRLCRPFLKRLLDDCADNLQNDDDELTSEDYARLRSDYVRRGGGTTSPGAIPIDLDTLRIVLETACWPYRQVETLGAILLISA